MSQPTSYTMLHKSARELNQVLTLFHQSSPINSPLERDAYKRAVLMELGAVCALIEHMTDKGELGPMELKSAIELKHKQLEGAYQWPRPQTFMLLV